MKLETRLIDLNYFWLIYVKENKFDSDCPQASILRFTKISIDKENVSKWQIFDYLLYLAIDLDCNFRFFTFIPSTTKIID